MVGIDAAVVANHQVAIGGSTGGVVIAEDFSVSPTLAGLRRLGERLSEYAGALVVAEPTAMSWLGLAHAVTDTGCGFALIETRHSSKLREAIAGKNKTDVIDADMLATSADLFGLSPSTIPSAAQIALRRVVRRRHRITTEAHNADVRLWALAVWAFPDLWNAMAGSHRLARMVFSRWPHLDRLARAHNKSIAALCRSYLRDGGDPQQRAERIRDAARDWARFWTGRLDLDAVARELTEMLTGGFREVTIVGLAIGGGLGALARYHLEGVIAPRQRSPFPLSTLTVNVSGSFLLGMLAGLALAGRLPDSWLIWGGAGFLGAFTTFSTFTYETVQLIEDQAWRYAALNLILTGPLSFGAAAVGYLIAS